MTVVVDDKHSKTIIDNIKTNYRSLTRSLPIDGLVPELYSKRVINDEQKEDLQKKRLKREKVSFLFDDIIVPELEAGGSAKFDKLIKVMEESDDLTAQHLAKRIKVIMYMAIKYNSIIITLHVITYVWTCSCMQCYTCS